MYAVIASGGKQEKVSEGQQVRLEVSAPNHTPVKVAYVFRKKKNEVVVRLSPAK